MIYQQFLLTLCDGGLRRELQRFLQLFIYNLFIDKKINNQRSPRVFQWKFLMIYFPGWNGSTMRKKLFCFGNDWLRMHYSN